MKRFKNDRINGIKKKSFRRRKNKKKQSVRRGEVLNYKNQRLLRRFITEQGKIVSKRISRLTSKQQRAMARYIKNARILAFIPFVTNET